MVDKHVTSWERERRVVCCWARVGGLVGWASTSHPRPAQPPGEKAVEACIRVVVDPCNRVSHACLLHPPMHCWAPGHGIGWVLYAVLGLQEAHAIAGQQAAPCKLHSLLHSLHMLDIRSRGRDA